MALAARGEAGWGLVGMLLIYRQIRSRLQTLNLIRNALLKAGQGQETFETAMIDPRLGREAQGWNRLLNRGQMGQEAQTAAQLEQLSQVVGGGGATEALGKPWMKQVNKAFKQHVFPAELRDVPVVASTLEDNAGPIGAALLAADRK